MGNITLGGINRQLTVGALTITETTHPALHVLPTHDHDNPNVNVVVHGRLDERVESQSFPCSVGTALFKPAGARHSNNYGTTETVCLIVEGPEEWFPKAPPGGSEVRFAKSLEILAITNRIRREMTVADSSTPLVVEGLALQLVGLMARATVPDEGAPPPRWVRRVRDVLEARACDPLTIGGVAAEIGVERTRLSAQFRRFFNESPGEYVRRRRVSMAAELMKTTGASLIDIALQCGFHDQSHFSRTFHRIMGLTPGRFRSLEGQARAKAQHGCKTPRGTT